MPTSFRRAKPALLAALISPSLAGGQTVAPTWRITVGPERTLDIGKIHNAPNGHISYQREKDSLTLWVDGRLHPSGTQATYRLRSPNWADSSLTAATPESVFAATHTKDACTVDSAWFRNYAAINAIIPGPGASSLLAFVDGEFHPLDTGTPLHASIGVATSTDGKSWNYRRLIIQGHNMVASHFDCNHVNALMKKKTDNVGAAGPSAVIRTDGPTKYIYLYYLDRILADTTVRPHLTASANIYVARSRYSDAGAPNTWEFWTDSGWSRAGKEPAAKPVMFPPTGADAAQPQVTYNTALKRWLMVFHTRSDLYASASVDGTTWDTPQPVGAKTQNNRAPAFPTLVDPSSNDQLTTGPAGLLFYSREVTDTGTKQGKVAADTGGKRKSYPGYVRTYTISTVPTVRKPPCATPAQCCTASGGTWSGGRCK
jgi:hypothetical protein